MKVRVIYRGGLALDFVVGKDILAAEFQELAGQFGTIRRVEFP